MLVAQSYYLQKDYANTQATAEKYTAGVAKPNEQLLLLSLRSSFELKDRAGTMKALESLVRYYPQQKYWEDLLTNQLYETKGDGELRTLYRLMEQTNTLDKADEYTEMATVLLAGGYPGEAQQVLERAMSANLFSGDAKGRAQADLDKARTPGRRRPQGPCRCREGAGRCQDRQPDGRHRQALLQRGRIREGGGCHPEGSGEGWRH